MASTALRSFLLCITTASLLLLPVSGFTSQGDLSNQSTVRLWPDGIIPYVISPDLGKGWSKILAAMKEWEQVTCLKFKPRTTEQNYVKFNKRNGCSSDIGLLDNGSEVGLGRGCLFRTILLHEIGHVIGLSHEHARPDRDRYITVLWQNIRPIFRFSFQIDRRWHPVAMKIPYDYFSIMHGGDEDFSSNGKKTMRSRTGNQLNFKRSGITALDGLKVRKMYKCPEFPDFPSDFHWSHDGRLMNETTCIKMDEPRDPNGWDNNYLCYKNDCKRPLNIKWSNSGPINGMFCTKITEPSKPSWDNNYLCVPSNAPYKFKWLLTKPSSQERKNCRKLNEPRDSYWSKGYHYLCATDRETDERDGQWSLWEAWSTCTRDCGGGLQARRRSCSKPFPANGGKTCVGLEYERQRCNTQPCSDLPAFPKDFSYIYKRGTLRRGFCLRTYDIRNYLKWLHYFLCTSNSKSDPRISWSYSGPRPGMRCTKIYNPIENKHQRGSWISTYLCVPMDSPYRFVWSINGPIKGLPCMRWYAQNGRNGWGKTYLCNRK